MCGEGGGEAVDVRVEVGVEVRVEVWEGVRKVRGEGWRVRGEG